VAIYIPIRRVAEDAECAVYHFGRDIYVPNPERPKRRICVLTEIGRVRISKLNGQITFEQTVSEYPEAHEARVSRKLRQALESGVFPPSLDYAA